MFADGNVICSETIMESSIKKAFEGGGKVSRSRTEYMCANERETGVTAKL